jgi:hypothetical protein
MKSQHEIQNMLIRFDNIEDEDQDEYMEGIHAALGWVLGHHDDSTLEMYLPD